MQNKLIHFLNNHFVGSLSTNGNEHPDIAIIFYVYKDGKLYFKSRTQSTHSMNLIENNSAAFSCYSHDSDYSHKFGVQIQGKVSRVRNFSEMEDVVEIYEHSFTGSSKKLPSIEELISENIASTFYSLTIDSFKIVDKSRNENSTMLGYQEYI